MEQEFWSIVRWIRLTVERLFGADIEISTEIVPVFSDFL